VSEPTAERIISTVSSIFDVTRIERSLDTIRFGIQEDDIKSKFVALSQKLDAIDMIARVRRSGSSMEITVNRAKSKENRWFFSSPWIPRVLFAVVIAFVMTNGYYRAIDANRIVDIGDPFGVAVVFTLGLLGILGVHELGHMVMLKYHRIKTTWPYFIPGIPIGGIPTFGAVIIQSKGLTINRETLFDVAIAGPIAGLVITIIVVFVGAYTAPIIPEDVAGQLYNDGVLIGWDMGEPVLMKAALAAFGKGAGGAEVLMTPLLFAAWFGFLITFLNMLPAWQLDGGHMARTMLGQKWHRMATYASAAILIWPLEFWFMGLMILLLSSRNTGAHILDDVSPLPRSRKYAFAGIAILAALCAPIP